MASEAAFNWVLTNIHPTALAHSALVGQRILARDFFQALGYS